MKIDVFVWSVFLLIITNFTKVDTRSTIYYLPSFFTSNVSPGANT